MKQGQKDRMLKGVVRYCIGFVTLVIVAVYIGDWFGVDSSEIVAPTCTVFGGELLLTALLKLLDKDYQPIQKTAAKKIPAVKKESEDKSNG